MTMQVAESLDAQTKAIIVLESLAGRTVAEICREYDVETTQFWEWRKTFLLNAHKVFDPPYKKGSESDRTASIDSLRNYIDDVVSEKLRELASRDSCWPESRLPKIYESQAGCHHVLDPELEVFEADQV
ncbi:MAG: transposase [Syntrophotaleaceae bacterium]